MRPLDEVGGARGAQGGGDEQRAEGQRLLARRRLSLEESQQRLRRPRVLGVLPQQFPQQRARPRRGAASPRSRPRAPAPRRAPARRTALATGPREGTGAPAASRPRGTAWPARGGPPRPRGAPRCRQPGGGGRAPAPRPPAPRWRRCARGGRAPRGAAPRRPSATGAGPPRSPRARHARPRGARAAPRRTRARSSCRVLPQRRVQPGQGAARVRRHLGGAEEEAPGHPRLAGALCLTGEQLRRLRAVAGLELELRQRLQHLAGQRPVWLERERGVEFLVRRVTVSRGQQGARTLEEEGAAASGGPTP